MKIKRAAEIRETVILAQREIQTKLTAKQLEDPKIQEVIIALSRARSALESCM